MTKRPRKSPAPASPGFAEGTGQPPLADDDLPKITLPPYTPRTTPPPVRSKIGPGGRVVIPAAFREALGMGEGADVMISVDGHKITFVTPRAAAMAAREAISRLVPPGVSLVDELLADRRAEVEAEERDERERQERERQECERQERERQARGVAARRNG